MPSCGHRTLRAAVLAVALLALAVPSAASAAENVYVMNGSLTYANTPGDADHVTVAPAGSSFPGQYLVSEPNTPTVSSGAGCTLLSAGEARCGGSISYVTVNTASGADRITIDADLPAFLYGLTGSDVLTGGSGADSIWGGGDDDTLHGRAGVDWLYGDDGDDIIEARDGGNDHVLCGDGIDTAYIDPGEGSSGCETVISDAAVASPVHTPIAPDPDDVVPDPAAKRKADADDTPAGTGAGRKRDTGLADIFDPSVIPTLQGPVQLASAVITVGPHGVASFDLSCAETESAPCRGSFFLDPVAKRKVKARSKAARGKKARAASVIATMARRGRFGRSPFVIAAGKRKKLAVKLSTAARKALGLPSGRTARAARRGRVVRARVTVVQKGRSAQHTVVTLRG